LTRYLGAPIHNPEGGVIGTLCFLDRSSEALGQGDVEFLTILAARVSAEIARERHLEKALAVGRTHLEELQRANEGLVEANHLITQMIRTVAHELRNPLTRVATEVYLFREARSHAERIRCAEALESAVDRLMRLTNDLLDYSRLDADLTTRVSEPYDPAAILDGVLRTFRLEAEAKGLTLTLDVEAAPKRVLGDAMQVEQIVSNLVSNAVRCTDGGEVSVHVASAGDAWTIAVKDHGIGIPAEYREVIFEEFGGVNSVEHQARRGTGLGLAICRRLAEAMGGRISVRSEEGSGSVFTVTLPAGACS
jgi:signal transduction histidine kinase